jgi:tRNA (mo5U34)-methyltransferase
MPDLQWFHSIHLGDEVTPGHKTLDVIQAEADVVFRHGVAGETVLDIGAWDGAFSFEAERRGAREVLATDHFAWAGKGWGRKAAFDYAHAKLKSKVRALEIDIPDITPDRVGWHDTVIMLGVLYHVKDPLGTLERAAAVTLGTLVLETVTTLNDLNEPVMRYFPGRELAGDPTNFWAPNTRCLDALLRDLGFSQVEFTLNPACPAQDAHQRHIVHATREIK